MIRSLILRLFTPDSLDTECLFQRVYYENCQNTLQNL